MVDLEKIKFNILDFFNKYPVKDLKQFEDSNYLIINENKIKKILDNNNNNKEKENYIFVVDSNLNINHAIDSIGFIEAKLTKEELREEVELIFIPLNLGYNSSSNYTKEKMIENKENEVSTIEELNKKLQESIEPNRVIELIAEKFKDKNVAINESFVSYIHIDKIFGEKKISFNDLTNGKLIDKFQTVFVKTNTCSRAMLTN
jgi:predicted metallopeptidase